MSAADQHRADAERFQHWAASASSDQAASAHASRGFLSAQLAIEARLGEVVDQLAEVARLLRPRSVDLGPAGIVHNAHGLSVEDINAAYERAEAIAHARKTGQTPAAGR